MGPSLNRTGDTCDIKRGKAPQDEPKNLDWRVSRQENQGSRLTQMKGRGASRRVTAKTASGKGEAPVENLDRRRTAKWSRHQRSLSSYDRPGH